MQNNILKFEPDQPQIIKLKYRTGKAFNKNGYQGFTYTTVSGLLAFFPPEVNKEIQALHIDAGQPIRITKKSSGAWDIERVAGEPSSESVHPQVSCASVDSASGDGAQRQHYPNATTNGSAPPMQPAWGMSILRQALFAVIDDAYEAETYAAGKGLAIRFSGEDIRCMANTAVINTAQGRG